MPIYEDENSCWIGDPVEVTCHGCSGKGWVETSDHQAHQCPVCLGSGKYNNEPYINPYEPYVPQYPQVLPYNPYPYNPPVIPNAPYPGVGYPWIISSSGTKLPLNISGSAGNSVGVVAGNKLEQNVTSIWPEK